MGSMLTNLMLYCSLKDSLAGLPVPQTYCPLSSFRVSMQTSPCDSDPLQGSLLLSMSKFFQAPLRSVTPITLMKFPSLLYFVNTPCLFPS